MLININRDELINSIIEYSDVSDLIYIVDKLIDDGCQELSFDEKIAFKTITTIKECMECLAKEEYNLELVTLCKDFIKQYEESE